MKWLLMINYFSPQVRASSDNPSAGWSPCPFRSFCFLWKFQSILKLILWSFPLIPPAHFVSLGNNLHFHNCGTDLLSSQLAELWLWKFNLIFRNPAFRFPPPLINFAPLKWKLSKGENAIDGVHRNVGNLAGQENAKMQPMDCIEILWNCPMPFLHWSHPLLFINKSTL